MEKVDYLIKFDADGNRGETHDAAFMTADEIADYKSRGFVAVSTKDYMKLLGNNEQGIRHIYCADEGTFIPEPEYEPTDAEVIAMRADEIASDYEPQLSELKDSLVTAVLMGDLELQAEIKTEYAELVTAYNNELEALNNDETV